MAKHILLILFLSIISFSCNEEQVLIEGIVLSDKKAHILISTIDTLTVSRHDEKTKKIDSLVIFHENIASADNDGFFSLLAFPSDSIYFKSFNHIPQSILVSDYLKRKDKLIELKSCNWEFKCDKEPILFAFAAKKISLEHKPPEPYCDQVIFNHHFIAKYKVIENVYGNIQEDTIIFSVFDHYGWPKFKSYENVLLYVSKHCDIFIHEKYQYQDIYKTKNGKWASPYFNDDYRYSEQGFSISPKKIEFENPVIFEYTNNDSIEWLKKRYPEPYYKIDNGEVIALYGNYLDELFEMKKLTILKSRGFFD